MLIEPKNLNYLPAEPDNAFLMLREMYDDLSRSIAELSELTKTDLTEDLQSRPAVVTMIGQVKAGKTALTSVLSGRPGLLPMDVNPWTSVVTSLNFNQTHSSGSRAIFQFFRSNEWQDLVNDGGRLGEIARLASRDDEIERLRVQADQMYAKSKARLGRNFELLLDNQHSFDSFDLALLERYICLGDDDNDTKQNGGRYADITRSADLYLDAPQFCVPLTLRDTPGVNDPFLVREQITLRALGDADVCLVVLSAHQALTTTDLGLIRVLTSFQQERVILFVNRIDELPDPGRQIKEIKKRIHGTLKAQGLAVGSSVVFGSALWARRAQEGATVELPAASKQALESLQVSETDTTALWEASGLPQLQATLGTIISCDSGLRSLDDTCRNAISLTQRKKGSLETRHAFDKRAPDLLAKLTEQLEALQRNASNSLEKALDAGVQQVMNDFWQSVSEFADRETDKMKTWLAGNKNGIWETDAQSLRRDLAKLNTEFAQKVNNGLQKTLVNACIQLAEMHMDVAVSGSAEIRIIPPNPPIIRPPVAVSRTITLDLDKAWWKGWFGKKMGSKARLKELRRLISVETQPMIEELRDDYILNFSNTARDVVNGFLNEQSESLISLATLPSDHEVIPDIELKIERLRKIEGDLIQSLDQINERKRVQT